MENPESIRGKVPADICAALPALVADARARLRPAGADPISAALTGTLAILGGPMSQADREAWQIAVGMELRNIPGDLALEGLQHARRTCDDARKVLPAVFEYAGEWPARRKKYLEGLLSLAAVSEVAIR